MKRLSVILLVLLVHMLTAQHINNVTQYMFNGTLINPAYCGSQRALNLIGLYRQQWTGIAGSPENLSFTAHSPLKNKKLNVGLIVEKERFGIYDNTRISGLYAYRVRLSKGHLAMGISAGMQASSSNWNTIKTTEENDPTFREGPIRTTQAIAGTGLYYDSESFYAGLAVPQLLVGNKFDKSRTVTLSSGFISNLGATFKMKPTVLIRYLINSPVSANFFTTFYYKDLIGVGVGYTYNSSVNALVDVQVNDQLRFGYGYEYSLTKIRFYSGGSHEIMLRYLFSFKVKAVSARYF